MKNDEKKSNPFLKLDNLILKTKTNKKTTWGDLKDFSLIALEIAGFYLSIHRNIKNVGILLCALLVIFGPIMRKGFHDNNTLLIFVGLFGFYLSCFLFSRLLIKK